MPDALQQNVDIVTLHPVEALIFMIKFSTLLAAVATLPLVLYYAWPRLKERGLVFVGIDVIGDYLTEINVTSPTCVRELDRAFDDDIGSRLMAAIEKRLNSTQRG